MKIRKSSIVLLIITLYGVNYFIFERIFFFNELLSLLGLIYFIRSTFRRDLKFYYPRSIIYRCILLFILICGIHAIVSLQLKTNWYYYFRNMSIIYSVFTFFLGFHLYNEQFRFFEKLRTTIYGYALVAFAIGSPNLIDRNAYSYWFALLQKKWGGLSVVMLILLYVLYVLSYTSLTVIMIMIVVLCMRFLIKNYVQFKIALILASLAFSILFILAIPYLKLYSNLDYSSYGSAEYAYSLFGNAKYVYSHHSWFWIDPNSSWRLIFWYRTIIEMFPQNLLGIGIGTPLLPYIDNINTTGLPFDDVHIAHVIGTHNTFVTILIRFGIIPLLVLVVIYRTVFYEFFAYKHYYFENKNDGGLFLSFITITVIGLFNLVIESPTLAGLYWLTLGFVAKAISQRKFLFKTKSIK